MTCIFKEKGRYFGRVEDPTTAKFAPFVNEDPDKESKYGVKMLTFKLWPEKVGRKIFSDWELLLTILDIKYETRIQIPHHSLFTAFNFLIPPFVSINYFQCVKILCINCTPVILRFFAIIPAYLTILIKILAQNCWKISSWVPVLRWWSRRENHH